MAYEADMEMKNVNSSDSMYEGRGGEPGEGKRQFGRRWACRFCTDKMLVLDYKDPQLLRYFMTDRGKIVPRRVSGNCAKHQRKLALAMKRARMIALIPFVVTG